MIAQDYFTLAAFFYHADTENYANI